MPGGRTSTLTPGTELHKLKVNLTINIQMYKDNNKSYGQFTANFQSALLITEHTDENFMYCFSFLPWNEMIESYHRCDFKLYVFAKSPHFNSIHLFIGFEWNILLFKSRQELFPEGLLEGNSLCRGLN